jgi:hypothetical protein
MDTSYLSSQVSTIIGQLHGLFDEIGVPSHERESRESEVSRAGLEHAHQEPPLTLLVVCCTFRNSTQSSTPSRCREE